MKSNIEWKKWGERDPLYAVATWKGKDRESSEAWTDDEFYELGRSDWADFVKRWQSYGLKARNCLEIGCGAGRLTKQIVQNFNQVTGVDVSPHKLEYARNHISASNITFARSNGAQLPVTDGAFDAVFSAHVFQQFDSQEDAFLILRETRRTLADNGTLMIHMPFYELSNMKTSKIIA
jgi:ubiquinone/menaquinone biosynthesis C-methylase UbiE